jgi:type IX secretion system PorP/SprF family membrane protein
MKQFLLVLCAGFLLMKATGQQQPHYTQYIINNYILNPALTGIENYTDVKISHRHQWVGIADAPVTSYITIHKPLGKKDDRTTPTSFQMPGENPRGKSYWQEYEAAKPHHGIGLKIINDKTKLNRFAGYVSYAYHIGIAPQVSLSAGFEAGVRNISLDRSKIYTAVPVDPAVFGSSEINSLKPDFGAGVWLYSADYFAGLSVQQIIPQRVVFTNGAVKQQEGKTVPHLFATAGYRFFINDDISGLPSVMAKYIQGIPAQFDVNMKVQYRDLLWVGGSYRYKYGFAGMVGLNVSNTFNIGYAYDYSTTPLNTVSRGTHEIVLGFLIGNKYGDWCPRNVW